MTGTAPHHDRSPWSIRLLVASLAAFGCTDGETVESVALVEITVPAGPIRVGGTAQFSATGKDRTGKVIANRPVTWSTSNASIARIDATGLLSALTGGSVSVLAMIDGQSGSVSVTIIVAQPSITQMTPNQINIGSNAQGLQVDGVGFLQGAVVRWNGQDRGTTFVSSTRLIAQISAADLANPGLHNVTVLNPTGGGESQPAVFTVTIQVAGPFAAVRMNHACGLAANGEAFCWGQNALSQLGDNTTTDRAVPTRVSTNLRFVAVGVGNNHSCALVAFGAAYCWGFNGNGQLGDGTTTSTRPTPVAVSGGRFFTALVVGASSACGLDGQGRAWCWGVNSGGQLGDGTTATRMVPTAVSGNVSFRSISAGDASVCGVTPANEVYCWGFNSNGQLGLGDQSTRTTPTRVNTPSPIATLVTGAQHTCAIGVNGTAYCWGLNFDGQLGTGSTATRSLTPVQVGAGFAQLAAGRSHTCGVLVSGATQCWGDNTYGQLGTGSYAPSNLPVTVQGGVVFRALVAGMRSTCGITQGGTMYCWGGRGFGDLGDGRTAYQLSPTRVGCCSFSSVQTSVYFSCGISSGSPRCWGLNDVGQLGNGTTTNSANPTQVTGLGTLNAEVAVGYQHACNRTNAGTVSCWGYGGGGQLGSGMSTNRTLPVLVSGGQTYRSISAGSEHTCGVTTAGQVMCWGTNISGELGTGDTFSRSAPAAVVGVPGITFAEVSAGTFHTCARTVAGAVYCWGDNQDGRVGEGTTTNRLQPVLINVGTTVARVAARGSNTCALATNGAAYCWGSNFSGELGVGGSTPIGELTPKLVLGGLTFTSLRVGFQSVCGVTTNGAAYCWGINLTGRLGIGTLDTFRTTPTQIAGFGTSSTYTIADPGYSHSCGVNSAGELACWGLDVVGELGLGIAGTVLAPAAITGVTFMIR